MKKIINMYKILAILPLLVIGQYAFAQSQIDQTSDIFGVMVNDKIYMPGDIITIKGIITEKFGDNPILITVSNPLGTKVDIAQIPIGTDMQFEYPLEPVGDFFKYDGVYELFISYHTEHLKLSVVLKGFEKDEEMIIMPDPLPVNPKPPMSDITCYQLDIIEHECLEYNITGGSIRSIEIDNNAKSIIISLDPDSDGELTINIPDRVFSGLIIVLSDGKDIYNTVTINDNKYSIPITSGTNKIELIGTFVIPEFEFAIITITSSLIAVMAVTLIARQKYPSLNIIK